MKTRLIASLVGLLAFASTSVMAADAAPKGDAVAGKAKSAVCGACHGADGNSVNPEWPKLAGQHESVLYKQMVNFKSKDRDDATMYPQVANLSEQDMRDLAAYYASQEQTDGKADMTQVELGEAVYRGGNAATGVSACMGCHGPSGNGNPAASFPKIAGQHAAYTKAQLLKFRVSGRANDAGKMMRNVAVRMNDAEIEAVSQFVAGLK